MNYIAQMNGFWRWRREHTLPASAQLLWYTLTIEQNHCLWAEEFEISTNVLRHEMGDVSVNTFRRARTALVRAGLLQTTMATKGGELSRFRLTQLYREKKKSPTDPSSDTSADPSSDPSADRSDASKLPSDQGEPRSKTLKPQNS